ncbi:MAG: UbiX family flavin prenyltransferase [Saprospiraceae bacterium]|nr:UbiX family flavin prenyltransferase [Saprospiraceae bacterium]
MKIAIGISGSSGSIYAKLLMDKLITFPGLQLAMVISENARKNIVNELTDFIPESYGVKIYTSKDFNAPFASGSAQWDALVVCPCSAGFMCKVSSGLADDLMSRSAQVMLKERKKLILVFRETPLSLIHIDAMRTITLAGGIICPAIPSFYSGDKDLYSILSTVTNRVIDLLGIKNESFRWGN